MGKEDGGREDGLEGGAGGGGGGGDIVEKKRVGGRERLRRRIVGVRGRGGMGGRRIVWVGLMEGGGGEEGTVGGEVYDDETFGAGSFIWVGARFGEVLVTVTLAFMRSGVGRGGY